MCLAVALAAPRFVDLKSTLLVRPTRFFAKYSYGFYLSHYFCIWLAFRKLHALPPSHPFVLLTCLLHKEIPREPPATPTQEFEHAAVLPCIPLPLKL